MNLRLRTTALAIFLAGALLRAQYVGGSANSSGLASGSNNQASTGSYSISGVVVNAATGEPVGRALVQLNMQQQQMMLTGADGRFEFQNLPAGAAMISAQKPGFFNPQEVGLNSGPIPVIQVGKDSGSVTLRLYPKGSIAGRVTSSDGEPIEGVAVRAIYQHVVDGAVSLSPGSVYVTTDDSGAYTITGLIPGKYFVATDARPVHTLSHGVRSFGEAFDEVYPATYFPGSSELSTASPVLVEGGQQAEADFSETPQRAYTVSGVVANVSDQRFFITLLDSDGNQVTSQLERKGNQFKIHNVVPGEYTLLVNETRFGDAAMYGTTPVGVSNSDVDGVSVEVSPAISIPISVEYEATSSQSAAPAGAPTVRLVPRVPSPWNPGARSRALTQNGQPVYLIDRVMPGSYRVEVQPNGPAYVASIRSGQTDLTRNELAVSAGSTPAPIEMTLRDGGATLKGTVKGGEQLTSVTVLAVPEGPSATGPRSFTVSPSFTIQGLAPGSYRLYAVTSINGLEYRNPEAMKKFDSVSVDVGENETKQVDIPLLAGNTT